MSEVFLYADETGNLDLTAPGSSEYFGFGTATFVGDHRASLMAGLSQRAAASRRGIELPRGFHATDDSKKTREEVFRIIAENPPRFDTTFLLKSAANHKIFNHPDPEMRLYKMAWYPHLEQVVLWVSQPEDTMHVIVGTISAGRRRRAAKEALSDVCAQIDRRINPCVWESSSSWGYRSLTTGSGRLTASWSVVNAHGMRRQSNRTCIHSSSRGTLVRHLQENEDPAIPNREVREESPWVSYRRARQVSQNPS